MSCEECGHLVSDHHHRGCRQACECPLTVREIVEPDSLPEAVGQFLGGLVPGLTAPSDEGPMQTTAEGLGRLAQLALIVGVGVAGLHWRGVPYVATIAGGVGYLLLALLVLAVLVAWLDGLQAEKPYQPPGWAYLTMFGLAAATWMGTSIWLAGGCL